MSTVDPTQQAAPMTPEQLLKAFWEAKAARDWWIEEEKRLRLALADLYCADPNGGYKNRTLDIGGGHKLEFTVTRTLKIDTRHANYLEWHKTAGTEKVNTVFVTKPATLHASLTGYNSLPESDRAAIAAAVTINEALSASFKAPKDER